MCVCIYLSQIKHIKINKQIIHKKKKKTKKKSLSSIPKFNSWKRHVKPNYLTSLVLYRNKASANKVVTNFVTEKLTHVIHEVALLFSGKMGLHFYQKKNEVALFCIYIYVYVYVHPEYISHQK